MKAFIKMSGNANKSVAGFHSWGVWREGSSDANGERFKEDDDKAMLKGPYEI